MKPAVKGMFYRREHLGMTSEADEAGARLPKGVRITQTSRQDRTLTDQ